MNDKTEPASRSVTLLEAIVGGLAVVLVAAVISRLLDAPPGSVAEWVSAIATVLALAAASAAAWFTRQTLTLEQNRDEERAEEARRVQASQVAVWASSPIEWRGPLVTVTWDQRGQTEEVDDSVAFPDSVRVDVLNASPLPVYQLSVEVYFGRPRIDEMVLGASYAFETPILGRVKDQEIATPEMIAEMIKVLETLPGDQQEPRTLAVGWTFLDNVRSRWRYVPGGRLERIEEKSKGAEPLR